VAIDVMHVTNLMIENHLGRLGEETDLIFLFGSREKGTAHPNSDVDLCYTPAHESEWSHCTVTVEGILFDLFPLHWSQLERMADFDDPRTSLIMDARVVYHRTEEALKRFRRLQDHIRELEQPAARPHMVAKAQGIFQQTGYPFLQLQLAARHDDLPSAKVHTRQIVSAVTHCLMVVNQTHNDTRQLPQVLALPLLPKECGALLDRIYGASGVRDLATTCEALLQQTRALLVTEQQAIPQHRPTYAEVFCGAYPEYRDMMQHVLRSCEAENPYVATDALTFLQEELGPALARVLTGAAYTTFHSPADYCRHLEELGFPDLLAAVTARDWTALREQALAFDRRLQDLLTEHGVSLNAFGSTQELLDHLNAYPAAISPPIRPVIEDLRRRCRDASGAEVAGARSLFDKVDCLQLPVPDLAAALEFYRDKLGHSLIWRTEGAAGLRLSGSEAELVLRTDPRPAETDLKVASADDAAIRFVAAGGTIVVGPFDIKIGRCVVVADPWGNQLVLLDQSKGLLCTDADGNVIS
jgi:predicted enzyme related to lactoylglutathione lyase